MGKASESILALKPVTFHYKTGAGEMLQFGLIAEEVAEVNPELVVRNEKGEVYSVRYDQVNAMLLNEFLKAHHQLEEQDRKSDEQKAAIAELQATVASLNTALQNQAAEIQQVKAEVQMSKAAPQLATTKR